ncbi:MAG TPA: PfkB family carbohydrate kinase [Streptosporangiaceae bacterium]
MSLDYLALGNPTLDVQAGGSFVLGGSVVYSALQAARLGLSAQILGRGNLAELGSYWQPYAGEVGMHLQPAESATVFRNVSAGDSREQWLEGWAGEIGDLGHVPDSDILHIAPVAQEVSLEKLTAECWSRFVLLTPQGLVRRWDRIGARIELVPQGFPAAVSSVVDVVVVSETEAPYVSGLLAAVPRHGGLGVVTRGRRGCEVLSREGSTEYTTEPVRALVDPTGAGDCFAATLATEMFRGRPVPEAIRLATAAASLCVSGQGPATIGGRQEIMSERGSSPGVVGFPGPFRPGG